MSMFLDNDEAMKFTKKKKLFLLKDKDMSVIARKTGKNSLEYIANPLNAREKIKNNTIQESNNDPFITIDFNIFKLYDDRETEIAERKSIIQELKKSSKKILNVRNAIICNGFRDTLKVVDLKTKEFKVIDKSLVDPETISPYHESQLKTILHDSQINKYKKQYERNKKLWEQL